MQTGIFSAATSARPSTRQTIISLVSGAAARKPIRLRSEEDQFRAEDSMVSFCELCGADSVCMDADMLTVYA